MENRTHLIQSLQNCVTACNHCAAACLDEDNIEAMRDCIKLDLDCADTCNFALQLLSRNSDNYFRVIELCKDICARCAEECDQHDHDHCQECAKACRRCEEHCRNYLQARG